MNFQQLRYVKALDATKSFVRAAERCAVTQPTLSNGIAQLEDELGERLFDRTTRTVSLTEFGRHVLPGLIDVLNAQSALIASARAFTHPARRLIRIGVSPVVSMRLVNLVIEPLLRAYPNVELIFREMNLGEMYLSLEAGQLEFVIGPVDEQGAHGADRSHFALYSERLFFIPKSGTALAGSKAQSISTKAIAAEVFVMVPDSCGLTRVTRDLFKRHKITPPEYSGAALSYGVLQDWAALGIGAAILPESKISPNVTNSLLLADAQGHPVMISYQVSWRSGNVIEIEAFANDLVRTAPAILAGVH